MFYKCGSHCQWSHVTGENRSSVAKIKQQNIILGRSAHPRQLRGGSVGRATSQKVGGLVGDSSSLHVEVSLGEIIPNGS